jgi:hypothetical protein
MSIIWSWDRAMAELMVSVDLRTDFGTDTIAEVDWDIFRKESTLV